MSNARLIAFYLPQFHPIPENDEWWGRGFTEWTNTAKAKPLFPGHYQPHVPTDLGFYDLRCPETREAQADLAREYGIEGFCYWHYWFAGKRVLERPFNEVLHSGKPDFPFCLGWANETWSGIWHGAPNRILIEQTYPGLDDHERHFHALLEAFSDKRYIRVDDKPLLLIYKPLKLPEAKHVTDFWRELAVKNGLPGLYLVGVRDWDERWNPAKFGFDAITTSNQGKIMDKRKTTLSTSIRKITNKLFWPNRPLHVYPYSEAIAHLVEDIQEGVVYHPSVIPNWDNTPRSGNRGLVLHGSNPDLFRQHLQQALHAVGHYPPEQRILFIKSWNEWAEGNHIEPDLRFGRGYLEAIRELVVPPSSARER